MFAHAQKMASFLRIDAPVVLFWFLVSGMAIILYNLGGFVKKIFFCCATVLRGIRTLVHSFKFLLVLLSCCAARDTHFSAFIRVSVILNS